MSISVSAKQQARKLTVLLIGLLLGVAMARWYFTANPDHALSSLPTIAYALIVILLARSAANLGLITDRFGTQTSAPVLNIILLAVVGLLLIKGYAIWMEPIVSQALESERDTSRFESVRGNLAAAITLIAFSWLIVFFEELAFRIVLFRLLIQSLGTSQIAGLTALFIQAIVFGLVHIYQGPTAVIGATFSGLVYGCLVLACRGSLWAAFLAHGLNNTVSLFLLYQSES